MEDETQELKIDVKIDNYTGEKPIEVVLRKGDAAKIKELHKAFNKQILLSSIMEFFGKSEVFGRRPVKENVVILYSKNPDNAFIEINEDPNMQETWVLTSKLEDNPDLQAFGINNEKYFTQKELEKFVLKYAFCFAEPAEATAWITSLRNFDAKYTTNIKKDDDRQGNKTDLVTQSITFAKGELPKILRLSIPLFKGTAKVPLELSVELDAKNGLPAFSFWCMDLAIQKNVKAEEYIMAVIDDLKETFVCLEQA